MGFATCGKRLRAVLNTRQTAETMFCWASGTEAGAKSFENTPEVRKALENFGISVDSVGCTCYDSGVCEYK